MAVNNLREVAQQALKAMEKATRYMSDADYKKLNESIETLRAALTEPVSNADGLPSALFGAALAGRPQTTHSEECWRWHHACAVAEVERLKMEMTTLREAAKQALDALETRGEHHPRVYRAIETLRAALAEPAPWIGLTDDERAEITSRKWWDFEDEFDVDGFARAIEGALKEKNKWR